MTSRTESPNEAASGRMDPALKAQWLAALRSGDYRQGNGRLRSKGNAFCCLGVLCEITGVDMDIYEDYSGVADGKAIGCLDAIELDDRNRLADLNDRGHSFAEIADWIEENL